MGGAVKCREGRARQNQSLLTLLTIEKDRYTIECTCFYRVGPHIPPGSSAQRGSGSCRKRDLAPPKAVDRFVRQNRVRSKKKS